ncbi:MAG: protein kinase [Proteobacteria bacterium]|nr:protein kinase [Pseudomonadota bacterium]
MPSRRASSDLLGELFGNYRILDRLGEGGMGTVYLAEHRLIKRKAAIKILLAKFLHSQNAVDRFFNEARATTGIHHPGIVQVFDYGRREDGSLFIVMEYLKGESLSSRLKRRGKLNPVEAVRIARHCASALAAAHVVGVIHRDLKPGNIFLVVDPQVETGVRAKILDFGAAKLTDAINPVKTSIGAMIGTPLYMSPEQCRGMGMIDHRSDIYSLGCVLFRMICGRPPFIGHGAGEVMASHLREPPPSPMQFEPSIPKALNALILMTLKKSPGDRQVDMNELLAELKSLGRSLSMSSGGGAAHQTDELLSSEFMATPASGTHTAFASTTLHNKSNRITKAGVATVSVETQIGYKQHQEISGPGSSSPSPIGKQNFVTRRLDNEGPIKFYKYRTQGKDFVLFDLFGNVYTRARRLEDDEIIHAICDRYGPIGADAGLVLRMGLGAGIDARVRVLTSDGSDILMSGLALQCTAKYLQEHRYRNRNEFTIGTDVGPYRCKILADGKTVQVDIGRPRLKRGEIPLPGAPHVRCVEVPMTLARRPFKVTAVAISEPYLVIFAGESGVLLDVLAETVGPSAAQLGLFSGPFRVVCVHMNGPTDLDLAVWRGDRGVNLAYGDDACAAVVAACVTGRAPVNTAVTVHLNDSTELGVTVSPGYETVFTCGEVTHLREDTIELDKLLPDKA